MFGEIGFILITLAYLFGGMTIGYYYATWKKGKIRRGDGRWD